MADKWPPSYRVDPTIDISMCWDGETPLGELTVDGVTLSGPPEDVRYIFNKLNALRDKANHYEHCWNDLKFLIEEVSQR